MHSAEMCIILINFVTFALVSLIIHTVSKLEKFAFSEVLSLFRYVKN